MGEAWSEVTGAYQGEEPSVALTTGPEGVLNLGVLDAPQRRIETVHDARNEGLNPGRVASSCRGVKLRSVH